ncbi:MAG: peptide chain release factor N(5)-glutamine methyltransferase [Eggerthellaceae bacterium]|nr:peptide chain release factor N(5)-glutamine methyltransferase [Eggerthellaceae bacterium]
MAQSNDIWTIKAALDWTMGYLERKGDENPRVSTQKLIAHACGLSRIELYTNLERPLTLKERDRLRDYVKRRAEGEPLQYIIGEVGFRFLSIEVAHGVLIPRPETEVLVSELLASIPKEEEGTVLRIVDVGTGSGCIACSIASERPDTHLFALDVAPEAIALCEKNASACGVSDRVTVIESDMLSSLDEALVGEVDAIVSNPPYIPTSVIETIPREVSDFEPRLALDGGADGLDAFRILLDQAQTYLKPSGVLAVELFEESLDEAARLANEKGYYDVRIVCDLAGRPRVLVARCGK